MLANIFLSLLGSSQIQSLVRSGLKMVGTALLVKFGLDASAANSVLSPILDALGGFVAAGAGLFLSAQNASSSISNPVLITNSTANPIPQA